MEWVTLWNISIFENAVHYNLLKKENSYQIAMVSTQNGLTLTRKHTPPFPYTYACVLLECPLGINTFMTEVPVLYDRDIRHEWELIKHVYYFQSFPYYFYFNDFKCYKILESTVLRKNWHEHGKNSFFFVSG